MNIKLESVIENCFEEDIVTRIIVDEATEKYIRGSLQFYISKTSVLKM